MSDLHVNELVAVPITIGRLKPRNNVKGTVLLQSLIFIAKYETFRVSLHVPKIPCNEFPLIFL